MRLYFDLSMGRLMQVAGYTSALGSMELKRGDAARLEISFTRGAAAAALTGTPSEMVFVVKKSLAAEGAVLMLAHDWTLDAVTGIWSAALSSDTVALTNQLGNSNFIDLLGEFSFTDDAGGPCTSQTIKVRVTNDLWKGTEDTPLALPTPATWLAAQLEALGLLALLDAPAPQPLAGPITDIFSLRLAAGLSLAEWARGAKMLTTLAVSPVIACVTSTGYAKFLRWDGTFGAVAGDGNPSHTITLTIGSAPASPYNSTLPKFIAVFPCLVGGGISGDLVSLLAPTQQLTAIDVRGLTALYALDVGANDLTSLDLGDPTDLVYLDCSGNRLTTLDLGAWENMNTLDCAGNLLTSLDPSGLPSLVTLDCSGNALAGVLAVDAALLGSINCSGNLLTGLDFGGSVGVATLNCSDNALTALDLTGLVVLTNLNADTNAMDAAAVDAAFLSLDAAAVAVAGTWTCYTNAAPTAASADRRAAMDVAGWTVTVEGIY